MVLDLNNKLLNDFPFKGKYSSLTDGNMHYIDEGGSGDPILFLHGNPTWSFMYRHYIYPLSQNHRVIVPDLLGFGLSDKPKEVPYTPKWHIQNITEFILNLNLQNITLVVHDWGGPIGLGFAVKHIGRIKSLIITNSWVFCMPQTISLHPFLKSIRDEKKGPEIILKNNLLIEYGIPEGIIQKSKITPLLMEAYRYPFVDPTSRVPMLKLVREIPIGSSSSTAKLFSQIESKLHTLKVPVLIIWGQQDPIFPYFIIDYWKKYFPMAKIHRLTKASHFLHEEEPEQVLTQIKNFM